VKKRFFSLIIVVSLAATLIGCGKNNEPVVYEVNRTVNGSDESDGPRDDQSSLGQAEEPQVEESADTELLEGKYAVLIQIENYGDISVELDADAAPITVTNFMKLVNEGYYNGLTFHRIMNGFMIQGGLSVDNPVAKIKGEFAANGIENTISHERGTISMARSSNPDSASAQFFICHKDSFFLDGQYAGFGHVISGMEVVDKICENAVVVDNNGIVPEEYQPVITGIYDVTAEYRHDVLDIPLEPANDLEADLQMDEFESYDQIISLLKPGMAYAYAEVLGADEPLLFISTEGVYDNGDGNMATISATTYVKKADGKVMAGSQIVTGGTAYPISTLDGVIYCGSNHSMDGMCLTNNRDNPGIMTLFALYEEFDSDANVTYGGFIRATNDVMLNGEDVAEDNDKPLKEAFEKFEQARPLNFTVIK